MVIAEVARDIGYSRPYISMVLRGRCKCSAELLSILASYFGVSMDDMFERIQQRKLEDK